jgi:hypothetical protein
MGARQGFKGGRFEPKIKEIPSGISLQLLSLYGMLNYVFSIIYGVLGEPKKWAFDLLSGARFF